MSDDQMTVGRYIEAARRDAGLTLRQLSEAADVRLTIVARLLRGEVRQPKPAHLMRIANALELRASDLFLLADLPVPKDVPSVEALLRAEYELPEVAVIEAKKQIDEIVARHRANKLD